MSKRDHISTETMAASLICQLLAIPHEHAKLMSAAQVISLVHRDHYPVRRDDGLKLGMTVAEVDHHSNITIRPIMEHREKTAKIDIPQIAKSKRLRAAQAALATFLATGEKPPLPKRRSRPIQSKGFDKGHRPLRSRNTFERRA